LLRVIERAMAFEPSARHESVAELSRALSPFAEREVTSRAAQYDLRRPNDAKAGAVTVDTRADTQAPVEGTLQSAVGDARIAGSANGSGAPKWWRWGLLLAAAASIWLLARDRQPPASAGNSRVETVSMAASTSPISVPDRVAPAATLSAESPTPMVAVSAVAEGKRKPSVGGTKPLASAAVSRRSKAVERQDEVTFDEKNPY
jgi:hypothetical protein